METKKRSVAETLLPIKNLQARRPNKKTITKQIIVRSIFMFNFRILP